MASVSTTHQNTQTPGTHSMYLVIAASILTCAVGTTQEPSPRAQTECLARVKEIHGASGPWAVVGYRMGDRALKELGLPRQSFNLLVVHHAPAEVQYSCVADGLQAATGASTGKLNLKLVEVPLEKLSTTIEDRKTGRKLTFTIKPELARTILNLPHEQLEAEGRRIATLPDDAIFSFVDSTSSPKKN